MMGKRKKSSSQAGVFAAFPANSRGKGRRGRRPKEKKTAREKKKRKNCKLRWRGSSNTTQIGHSSGAVRGRGGGKNPKRNNNRGSRGECDL